MKKSATAVSARRRPLVVGNWKMNPGTPREAVRLVEGFRRKLAGGKGVDVCVCPPAIYLGALRAKFPSLSVGLQDVSAFPGEGAHTGDVSASMAKASGVSLVVVGHSERRAQGEADELVARKVAAVLAEGLTAVLCVGERIRDERGEYLRVLAGQIEASLAGVPAAALSRLVVAYEPVWAIGAGKEAIGPQGLLETALYVRKCLRETLGPSRGDAVPIIYGGSVDAENAAALLSEGEVDGFLVGRASLDAHQFAGIVVAAGARKR